MFPHCLFTQIGGSEHAAEIHWVHLKEGTEDELLVIGVLFDTSEYGSNVEVSTYPASKDVVTPQSWMAIRLLELLNISSLNDGYS